MSRRPYDELAAQLAHADELAAALKLENAGLRVQLGLAESALAQANARLVAISAQLERALGEIQALEVCNGSMRRAVNDAARLERTALADAILGASIDALADGAQRLADARALDVEEPT